MGKRIIPTTRFGETEVDEALFLQFEEPILGFEGVREYVILDHAENSPFKWLQAATEPSLAFVITNPKLFGIDYEFFLPENIVERLGITTVEEVLVLTIVNIPADNPLEMTANLLGPIIINENKRKAMQIVLNDTQYSTRARLIQQPEDTGIKTKVSSMLSEQKD